MDRVRARCVRLGFACALTFGAGCATAPAIPPPNETMLVNMGARMDDATRAAVDAELEALFAAQREIF